MNLFSISICCQVPTDILTPLIELGCEVVDNRLSVKDALESSDFAMADLSERDNFDWFMLPHGRSHAVYFKKGSSLGKKLRSLFIRPASLVGAGIGRAGVCSLEGINKLKNCDVCLHDSLLDSELLSYLPDSAEVVYVGKRCGSHSMSQREISQAILDQVRKGKRVVRLKGGDPTIFGRIAEEIELLEEYDIPYEVTPAVSSFQCASIDSGGLLTRRGISAGFTIMSARDSNASLPSLSHITKASLPIVFYMGTKLVDQISNELIKNGLDRNTPLSIVYSAGSFESRVVRGTIGQFSTSQHSTSTKRPGVVVIGDCAKTNFKNHTGALMGARVLVTGSDYSQSDAKSAIEDLGGRYISFPLVNQVERHSELNEWIRRIGDFNWVVLTNPKSVELFGNAIIRNAIDIRKVPLVLSTSSAVTQSLRNIGIIADSEGDLSMLSPQSRISLLGSDVAVASWKNRLEGYDIEIVTSYDLVAKEARELPLFDLIYFSSSRSVKNFVHSYGEKAFADKSIVASGDATKRELEKHNIKPFVSNSSFGCGSALREYVHSQFKKHFSGVAHETF